MARCHAGNPIGQIRSCQGDQLLAQTLASPDAVRRRRKHRDRQQRCRTSTARPGPIAQEFPVRRCRFRRRTGSGHVHVAGNGQARRPEPGSLPAPRTGAHRRSPDQPDRRTPAVERGRSDGKAARRSSLKSGARQDGVRATLTVLQTVKCIQTTPGTMGRSTHPSSLGTSIGPENRSIPKVDARKVGAQFRG
jgi:hypothetical protein